MDFRESSFDKSDAQIRIDVAFLGRLQMHPSNEVSSFVHVVDFDLYFSLHAELLREIQRFIAE